MNKIWAEGKNGKLLVCVLEPGNIHKLTREMKPIEIALNEGPYERGLPAKLSVVICYSETPVSDSREFEKMLAPEGVKIDARTPVTKTNTPHFPECPSPLEQLA